MSFSLLLVPCTFTLGNWIFQLVLLNLLPRCLRGYLQVIFPGAWAVFHSLPHTHPLRRKLCSLFPEKDSLENLKVVALSAKLDSSQFRSWCAKLLARMLLETIIVFRILEVPSQKLGKLYYIEIKILSKENHSCSFLLPFPFKDLYIKAKGVNSFMNYLCIWKGMENILKGSSMSPPNMGP